MACVVMARMVMAYTAMAHIALMTYILMAYIGMACIGMAYIVMADICVAYILMAYNWLQKRGGGGGLSSCEQASYGSSAAIGPSGGFSWCRGLRPAYPIQVSTLPLRFR